MSTTTTEPQFLLLSEVARICRAPHATVRHWIRTGRLPSTKPGRRVLVRREALEQFLRDAERTPPAASP